MKNNDNKASTTWEWLISAIESLTSLMEHALIDCPVPTREEHDWLGKAGVKLGKAVLAALDIGKRRK